MQQTPRNDPGPHKLGECSWSHAPGPHELGPRAGSTSRVYENVSIVPHSYFPFFICFASICVYILVYSTTCAWEGLLGASTRRPHTDTIYIYACQQGKLVSTLGLDKHIWLKATEHGLELERSGDRLRHLNSCLTSHMDRDGTGVARDTENPCHFSLEMCIALVFRARETTGVHTNWGNPAGSMHRVHTNIQGDTSWVHEPDPHKLGETGWVHEPGTRKSGTGVAQCERRSAWGGFRRFFHEVAAVFCGVFCFGLLWCVWFLFRTAASLVEKTLKMHAERTLVPVLEHESMFCPEKAQT